MADQIYVIGHVNPDTDSIASAMGYAWLLRERDGADTVAARAGALNPQTSWVLKTLGLEPPVLLTDASPRFESVMRRLDTIRPDQQLGLAWILASRTGGIAPVVNEDGKPYGMINGMSLFKYFTETLGPRPGDTTVREMMSAPCRCAADTTVPKYAANAHIRDILNRILRDEYNDYWVVDEQGIYLGIASQTRCAQPAAPQDHPRGSQRTAPGHRRARRSRTAGDPRSSPARQSTHPHADPLYGGYRRINLHAGLRTDRRSRASPCRPPWPGCCWPDC